MRVLFLEAVQNFGGARKSTIELAIELKQTGHDVLVVDFWGSCIPFIRNLQESDIDYLILDERERPLVIADKNLFKYIMNLIKYFSLYILYRIKFRKVVATFRPDIVSVNNSKCLSLLSSFSMYSIDYFARGWFSYKSLSFKEKILLKIFKPRFIAISQATRQAIYTGGLAPLQKINVCSPVIEAPEDESNLQVYNKLSMQPIKILHSAGFLKTKGQHVSLKIAKLLKERGVPFKLTFTGIIYHGYQSQNYYNKLLQSIKDYDLTNEIEIVLNKSSVKKYFLNCDILIHPSYTEGMGRVVLEALSLGKPVIANPVGGVTDLVIHNMTGYLTDFNDTHQYADYICKYYNDSNLYERHSKNAFTLVKENYNKLVLKETINKLYIHKSIIDE